MTASRLGTMQRVRGSLTSHFTVLMHVSTVNTTATQKTTGVSTPSVMSEQPSATLSIAQPLTIMAAKMGSCRPTLRSSRWNNN